MTLTLHLDPTLEARVSQEARRLGISESAFVQDVLQRALGMKNPAELLDAVRSNTPMGDPDASEHVSDRIREKLRAQRAD